MQDGGTEACCHLGAQQQIPSLRSERHKEGNTCYFVGALAAGAQSDRTIS